MHSYNIYNTIVILIRTVELQRLEHHWNYENMLETGVVELMSVNHSARSEGMKGYIFDFLYMKVYCLYSFESPHRGDSNEYTQYTIYNIKKKTTLNYSKSAAMGYFQGS